jgi:hypothetical protein
VLDVSGNDDYYSVIDNAPETSMQTQYGFSDLSFQQALARARAAEAAELAAAAAGKAPQQSQDIGDMLRRQAQEHLRKVLGA